MPKTASKANAILKLKEILKCDEIVCFGDAINDLEMFKVVDYSFTFKTSPQDIQQQTTFVVSSVKEAVAIVKEE